VPNGSGNYLLSWNPPAVGTYQVKVTYNKSSGGSLTTGILTLHVTP
jgi:hypothetical protein